MYRKIKYETVLNEKGETVSVATGGEYFSFAAEGEIKGLKNWRAKFKVIVVPDGVREIRGGAFSDANVQTVVLPDGLEVIGKNAFANCVNFKRIYIPSSVKEIGKDAFAGCKLLKIYCEGEPQTGWIDLPDEVKTYYDDMTEAFNFHRSAGSFDERHLVERKEIIKNTYNPEKRPVHTNVSREEFLKTLK